MKSKCDSNRLPYIYYRWSWPYNVWGPLRQVGTSIDINANTLKDRTTSILGQKRLSDNLCGIRSKPTIADHIRTGPFYYLYQSGMTFDLYSFTHSYISTYTQYIHILKNCKTGSAMTCKNFHMHVKCQTADENSSNLFGLLRSTIVTIFLSYRCD